MGVALLLLLFLLTLAILLKACERFIYYSLTLLVNSLSYKFIIKETRGFLQYLLRRVLSLVTIIRSKFNWKG